MPVVCVLGIQSKRDSHKQLYDTFVERIAAMEESVYKAANDLQGSLNDKVHRVQFGFVNVERNWKVGSLIAASKVINPKYLIVLPTMARMYIGNNLGELENLIDDAMHGEFDEYKNLRDYMPIDHFEDLLLNESLSILSFIWYTVKHGFFWSAVLSGVIYWLMRNRLQRKHAIGLAVGLPVALLAFEVLSKCVHEELL